MKTCLIFVVMAAFLSSPLALAEGPCKKIKEACEDAGFTKHDHKDGKALWPDCINKIMANPSVIPPGVKVTDKDVGLCKPDSKKN